MTTHAMASKTAPHAILECLQGQVAEFHCGLVIHPEWPASWYEAKLSGAAEKALRDTMRVVIAKALDVLPKKRAVDRWDADRVVEKALDKHLKSLVAAMLLPPKVRKWEEEIRQQNEEFRIATATLREQLASAKREYRDTIGNLTSENDYPDVPDSACAPSDDGSPLPDKPGVYFVWSKGVVVYVGQSIRLCQRAKLGHDNILVTDQLSWLEFPIQMLNFAEAFYIGVTKPLRNFGRRRRE